MEVEGGDSGKGGWGEEVEEEKVNREKGKREEEKWKCRSQEEEQERKRKDVIAEVRRVDGSDKTLYLPAAECIRQHVNVETQYQGLLSQTGQTWTDSGICSVIK